MLKKFAWGLLFSLLLLGLVVTANTLHKGSRQLEVAPLPKLELDQAAVATRLAEAVRLRTVSAYEDPKANLDQFRSFHTLLQQRFPKVHSTLGREFVGELSLLYTWKGSKPDVKPILFMAHQDVVPVAPGTEAPGGLKLGIAFDTLAPVVTTYQDMGDRIVIGDVVGQPMLAHKATHEGKVAAEVAAGLKTHFDARVIPSVAYTDPEIAWAGATETTAKAQGLAYEKAVFPWAASGRALSISRTEGLTKLIFDKTTHRLVGAGIVGTNAGELLAETVLAIEMGADAEDLGLTIHSHPTLSETVGFAAEMKQGTITDLYIKKR